MKRTLCVFLIAAGVVAVAGTASAALIPVTFDSQEELFEIPNGTWKRRMSGDKVEILPDEIYLVLGIRNILHLKNSDDVPQIFGPTLIMPGQSLRLPFEVASDYQFACTAHVSGTMTVVVDELPDSPWMRLKWRVMKLFR